MGRRVWPCEIRSFLRDRLVRDGLNRTGVSRRLPLL